MPVSFKQGGQWETPRKILTKKSGTWRTVFQGWVKEAGAWEQIWEWQFVCEMPSGNNLVARDFAVSQGWDEEAPLVIIIPADAVISGTGSTAGYDALLFGGNFPNGVHLINNGAIIGRGGAGGTGGDGFRYGASDGLNGEYGYTGLGVLAITGGILTVENNGYIAGGGGGGGGGAGVYADTNSRGACASGAGGGGGRSNVHNAAGGTHGYAQPTIASWMNGWVNGGVGATGTINNSGGGGGGGRSIHSGQADVTSGAGGSGGFYGDDGGNGGVAHVTFALNSRTYNVGGAGGIGGAAVYGINNMTWTKQGTIYGKLVAL